MDPRTKFASQATFVVFVAAGMMSKPPAALSASDPLSYLYMGLSFLCLEAGMILLLFALLASEAVVLTVLPSFVEKLRGVLAVPLLMKLTVGATLVSAAANLIVLGCLIGDMVGIWGN